MLTDFRSRNLLLLAVDGVAKVAEIHLEAAAPLPRHDGVERDGAVADAPIVELLQD